MKFTLTERGASAGGEVIEFMKRKTSSNCTDGTDVLPTVERFCQVTDQCRPPPNYGTTSYKTIHYERQTQLRFKHKFDVDSFCKQLRCWCCQAGCERGQFILRFEFTLPKRRKTKRNSVVLDLVSTKEYEAAHTGLMYACSLFNIFADEFYGYGCRFDRGLQIGPSWVEKGKVKTCAVLSLSTSLNENITVSDVLTFAVKAVFSAEDLHHMQAVTAEVYFNGELLGSADINPVSNLCKPLEFAQTFYSSENVQKILYTRVRDRNVLYAFKTERGIRQGMMVKTGAIWNLLKIQETDDLYRSVKDFNVVEFIPAVNRIHEEYPSVITIETDPGDMFVAVLGKKKSWRVNTYVAEKICNILDRYRIHYMVKFSGNKGWHIQVPVELKQPFKVYQKVVEVIVNKELGTLPDEEKVAALELVDTRDKEILHEMGQTAEQTLDGVRFTKLLLLHFSLKDMVMMLLKDICVIVPLNHIKIC
ncbi:MAG: hypothetical protein HXS48_12580 [Theionarchaea archaeon]|nr:hypothetical protein [Theionarchaea archaeon]